MSSAIPGYEYDIFISYRQKDNKGDRWVSEFVEALKTELESTFKDEVSVYFDISPNDGLLETHDVDASLKEKLKCLVFIPIISRTYCDPKSFAWEHEFKAFVLKASHDKFGLKVRLPNGNVASRVLPVRIHELGISDITECESVLGGILRGVEFIYKEPGVDRPLTTKDNEEKNLNKTNYRNQINKVALALRDIITSITQYDLPPEDVKKEAFKPAVVRPGIPKTRIIAGSLIALALIILGFFMLPKLLKSSVTVEKSVAVLPFTNLSNDTTQVYFSDGIVEAILNHLFKVGDLKVISSTSTKRYRNTELSIKEIGRELGVASILEGSVQKTGNNVRITAQLIDAKTDVHLWSEIYDRNISDIFTIQSEVAQNVANELKATLTSEEKKHIKKNETENPEAYNLYLQGRFYIEKRTSQGYKKGIEYFEKAVAADPDYALAYAGLADAYFLLAWYNEMPQAEAYARSKEYVNKALRINKNLAEAHTVLGGILTWNEWKWEEARKELQLAVELNPNFVTAHSYYAELLDILRENSEARKQINLALEIDPFFPMMRALSSLFYYHEGKFRESLIEDLKVLELTSDDSTVLSMRYFYNYIGLGEDRKAVEALEKILLGSGDTLLVKNAPFVKDIYNKSGIDGIWNWLLELELRRQTPNPSNLAIRYARVGKKEEALYWLEKYFENQPTPRINNDPNFEVFRSEPIFQAMLVKMGLSEYQTPK
jgi:TolB-like protein